MEITGKYINIGGVRYVLSHIKEYKKNIYNPPTPSELCINGVPIVPGYGDDDLDKAVDLLDEYFSKL